MCAIIGVIGEKDNSCLTIYNALTVLQHRGQDAAGMAVCDKDGFLKTYKDSGLVRDVFSDDVISKLMGGTYGLGHTRYPTAGKIHNNEAQPFYVNSPFGISLVHNGNLVNTLSLKEDFVINSKRHINSSSDSELLLNVFAECLSIECKSKKDLNSDKIFKAISLLHSKVEGAYAVVLMVLGYGLVAFRDPNGIRPLIYGKKGEKQYMVASESVALDCLGYYNPCDIKPGQSVVFEDSGGVYKSDFKTGKLNPCIFEYVYLARPDSTIDKVNVYQSRLEMGKKLAFKIKKVLSGQELEDIDVVIPIPDTSRNSALPISIILEKELREGFVKNRYIGRTFIMPGQKIRRKSVKQKLNTINLEFKNKNVLLIDDSIVRGNTSKEIVQMAKDAGAKKIYFASASPAIRHPNVYGIDMPYVGELIAYNRTTEQICELIGADKLIYQDIEDLEKSVMKFNKEIKSFDSSCFTGNYLTKSINMDYLKNLESIRKGK
ncbi:MAG: amidophosphoribosyltransferase [Candidatus Marinimicrobia bacterium]|nr:amidophosphoribosyltransferase [Candidatus Neomarinimicrobiota bacterium]|tara:strand:- start:1756 stop:3222 length:1467 start_codon:yes stop_codon:yes gene_type:complete